MRAITIDKIMSWHPCYSRERVEELLAGREAITALEILDLDIPSQDRLWAVLREEFFALPELRELACDFAEHVLPLFEQQYPRDDRPRRAIEVSRRYARGEATRTELATARNAAYAAAQVAYDAAAHAAHAATAYAAYDAAAHAVYAAYAAYAAEAAEAEKAWQLETIRCRLLKKGGKEEEECLELKSEGGNQ